MIALKRSQET